VLPVTLRKTSVKEPKAKVKVCTYAVPCYIRYREGECQLCGEEDENLDKPDKR
jgi:hypothetical protein